METLYADPINGSKTTSRLADAMTDKLGVNKIEAQVDAGGATVVVRNGAGASLGEVFVELSGGNILCHVWGKEALNSGPVWTGILANRYDIKEG